MTSSEQPPGYTESSLRLLDQEANTEIERLKAAVQVLSLATISPELRAVAENFLKNQLALSGNPFVSPGNIVRGDA